MLVLEAVLVAAVFLLLFRLRVWLGLSLLFVAIGVMQPIQVHLSTYMYVEVLPGLRMSPGSVVLFPASLFAVLLVYIREDAVAVRKVIYGLVAANLLVSALYLLLDLHAGMASTSLVGDAAGAMYVTGARSMAAGTAALLVDVVALIVVYEWIGRGTRRSLFLRTFLTLAVVLAIDSVIFATAAFAGTDLFGDVLVAGLVGKSVAALLFSMAMVAYLRLFEREAWSPELAGERPIRDVFHALTYREKYEAHRTVAARAQAKADEHRIALLHATKDGILTVDQHLTIEDASRSAEATFCVAPEAMVGRALGAFLGSEALFDAIRHQVAPDGPLEAVGLRGGQEFPVEVVVVPLHERRDGGAVLSVRDLTERRRAELARAEESMTNVV
ncbi:MAG: VUT family protein, partial [Planctomycetes bacterium]|nr:VUT family protein [Planctomycetota bacterium]